MLLYPGQSAREQRDHYRVHSRVRQTDRVRHRSSHVQPRWTHHARRELYELYGVRSASYASLHKLSSQQGGRQSMVTTCVEIITTGLARKGREGKRRKGTRAGGWNRNGIMELWTQTQTTARVRDQDRMDGTGQNRTRHHPVATLWSTEPQESGYHAPSCTLMQPSTRGLTGVEGPARFDF